MPGVVYQCAVYSAGIAAFAVYIVEFFAGEAGVGKQVLKGAFVLYFAHAYEGGIAAVYFAEYCCEIAYLAFVFFAVPAVFSFWQIFVVVLALVVYGVEEVFEVLECYAAIFSLVGGADDGVCEQQKYYCC